MLAAPAIAALTLLDGRALQAVPSSGTSATAYTGVGQAMSKIFRCEAAARRAGIPRRESRVGAGPVRGLLFQGPHGCARRCCGHAAAAKVPLRPGAPRREEGVRAFWKGNGVQILRIFPYSAGQLMTNDLYKRLLATQASWAGGRAGRLAGERAEGRECFCSRRRGR